MKRSSIAVVESNDENNFPHKVLLTNTQNFQNLLQIILQLIKLIKNSIT